MNVIAVIGDVMGSRKLSHRQEFQERLKSTAVQTNRLAAYRVESLYTITLGDEVQAVYMNANHLVDHILYFMSGVTPQTMRFSIGVGSLTTAINPDQAIGMDGPAFHAARDGLEKQRKSRTACAIWTSIDWQGPDLATADAAIQLIGVQVARWRPARWKVAQRLIEGLSETETAAALGIERQAVNEHVRTGAIRVVRAAGKSIDAALTQAVWIL